MKNKMKDFSKALLTRKIGEIYQKKIIFYAKIIFSQKSNLCEKNSLYCKECIVGFSR
jgi:hypothetical protein